jgi:hypothetical protein
MPKSKPKVPVKKTAAKSHAKKTLKPTKKTAAAKTAMPMKAMPQHEQGSFMWRLLKKKQAEREALAKQNTKSKFNMHPTNEAAPSKVENFAKFHGPRRKAA